jgi:co-chaperonin GroES (HSP10)
MYYLSPRNRYLLVEQLAVKVEVQPQHAFILPADYKEKEKPYKVVRVIEDSTEKYEPESLILVPTHMLEEIEIDNQTHYLIQENHILATVTKEI